MPIPSRSSRRIRETVSRSRIHNTGDIIPKHLPGEAGGMNCLHCGQALPEAVLTAWERAPQAKSGRFACPSCGADHVRRAIGKTPEGKPLFTLRLWGHPTTTRKRKDDRGRP